MRALGFSTLFVLASTVPAATVPVVAQSATAARLDPGQAEAAARLIDVGDTVRLFCKPCSDVAYTAVAVRSRELRPARESFELLLNGEPVDAARIYVDGGFGDGWENLALMIGALIEGPAPKLSAALDDVESLARHAGTYTGKIGAAEVRLDLVLRERKLDGAYVREGDGLSFKLLATAYNLTRDGESLTLIERGAGDRVTATLRGELDGSRATFTGVRQPLGGAESAPFQLARSGE